MSDFDDKLEAALNAKPVDVPQDKEGYFAWLKSSDAEISNLKPIVEENKDASVS